HTASDITCRRSVPLLGQRTSENLDTLGRRPSPREVLTMVRHQRGHPPFGEPAYALLTFLFRDKPQSGHREVVISVPKPGTPHFGEQEEPGRSTPAPPVPRGRLPRACLALDHQGIQVPADRSGADAEFGGYR